MADHDYPPRDAGPLVIRPAEPADAGVLAELRYEFRTALHPAAESRNAFVARCRAWIERSLAGAGCWRCWVAEEAAGMRGMIWLQLVEKMPNPVAEPEYHGYVTSLYLQPACRGRGSGSALLETALSECAARGVDAVFLWPTERSRSLYRRHGFAVREDLLEWRPVR
jgi:ribosomal protein S18 acetylase RimI-like enzyme